MPLKTVLFESGHRLVDNKVGDYYLDCPEHGNSGFLHMGIVAEIMGGLTGASAKASCSACGNPIGELAPFSPFPYDQAEDA